MSVSYDETIEAVTPMRLASCVCVRCLSLRSCLRRCEKSTICRPPLLIVYTVIVFS